MADAVTEFFATLPDRLDHSRTAGMRNTYVFDVEGTGIWTVRVDDGQISVAEGDEGGDCTISASSDIFEKIVRGEQNATTAYMTGRLKVRGDIGAAMKLQKLF